MPQATNRLLSLLLFAVAVSGLAQLKAEEPSNWWSLRPLEEPAVPFVADTAVEIRTPIDAFVRKRLGDLGLSPSPRASRRELIRRVTIDLTGLPPTPHAVRQFQGDARPDAYSRLVERLLASPRYGERWARHWLDVVHYGDTHGYDKDKPRPNAWPYRDYVVRAFNADKPYARFVREQLAGDVLYPDTRDGIVATGFIAAGPWDFIGHAEVPESKLDGQVARNLDRDDMVRTAITSFVSLTVQCARCHDHKFDDVTMTDYYSLQAVFAALDRADRPYDPEPDTAARRGLLAGRQRAIEQQLASHERDLLERGGDRLAEVSRAIARGLGVDKPNQDNTPSRPEFGYHSRIVPRANLTKWVQVDLGSSRAIDRVLLVGCHDDFNNIGDGFGFPPRFKVELSDDPTFRSGVTRLFDRTARDFPNPGTQPVAFSTRGRKGRFLRVTATRLAARQNDYIFAMAELRAIDAAGKNLAAGRPVTALDSIEAPPRWRKANLVDGIFPTSRLTPRRLAAVIAADDRWQELRKTLAVRPWLKRHAALASELDMVEERLALIPARRMVYAGTVHTGSGTFRGTGHNGGRPRPIHILLRGDIHHRGPLVGPGTADISPRLRSRFDLPAGHPEGQRRVALAEWIVDRHNPLTWRSIANRMWQYHFARPLVATPNDFGRMGEEPTHPRLLDWLACRLRDRGGSLKDLHRVIVTSATYQQSSRSRPDARRVDADNRLLWRMNRRRVEAEVVRDAVLSVAGRLDDRMYGPGFRDFVIEKPQHSPHYEYDKYDPNDVSTHRRSIYRFLVRSQPQPLMSTLDCADPSRMVARRDETISPLQALAMLNNRFMTTMAVHFANRVATERPTLSGRIGHAFELAIGRPPTPEERQLLSDYARRHGLPHTCRLILNLNEFVFVD